MFDISWGELMLIGVVALIVIGPKELPGVLRMVGQWMGKIRRMAAEFQSQFQEAMREAEMSDLKKQVDELNDTARGMSSHFEPVSSGPTAPASSKPDVAASATPAQVASVDAQAPAVATEPVAAQPLPDVSAPSPEPAPAPDKDLASAGSEQVSSPPAPREVEGDRRA